MMLSTKQNYESLKLQYVDKNSIDYKKLRLVDSYIDNGQTLLDIGVGTGELIDLEKNKFDIIYGIDSDKESVEICRKRFENDRNIYITLHDINNLKNLFQIQNEKFDCITCLDVLEHIKMEECEKTLNNIYNLLKDDGKFIFTGPGVFEKIKILLGRSPTHLHSHSSYGWKRMIEKTGFKVITVETVEFPIIHSDFLRKKMHLFGKCCIIVSKKVPNLEIL